MENLTTGQIFAIAACLLAFYIGMALLFHGFPEINIHKHYKNKKQ